MIIQNVPRRMWPGLKCRSTDVAGADSRRGLAATKSVRLLVPTPAITEPRIMLVESSQQ